MNNTSDLDLMLNALTEIIQEEKAKGITPQTPLKPAQPNLSSVLARITPLPSEALFLGMANDGLPVLLNLFDPVPGPLLIAGDSSTGKTRLLQTIACGVENLHAPELVKYCVVTTKPDEWQTFYGKEHNLGIYKTDEENTAELIKSLAEWAHNNKGDGQCVLLFVDGMNAFNNLDLLTQQNLRWLLLRGPSRRVWIFATLDTDHAKAQMEWLELFRTRLFSFVEDAEHAKVLAGKNLDHLTPAEEFAMREDDNLLKFWLPSIEERLSK